MVRLRQALGQETKTSYNRWGFKASQTDANGNDASWSTDYFGRILGHKDIGEAVYSYVYDAAGQLTAQTNDTAAAPGRLAQSLRYGYDAAGGLVLL